MSETTTTEAPTEPAKAQPEAEPAKAETDWQAEARKWESRAKANKEASDKLAALEDAQKSESTKLTERAETAERELAAARLESNRASVALEKGLTTAQAKRLVGTTREELDADADELLADLGTSSKPTPTTRKPPASGASNPDAAGLTGKEKAADALRRLRGQGQ